MSRARLKNINGLSRVKLSNQNFSKVNIKYNLSLNYLINFFFVYNSPNNFTIIDCYGKNKKKMGCMQAVYPIFKKLKLPSFTKKKFFFRSNLNKNFFFFGYMDSSIVYKRKLSNLKKEHSSLFNHYDIKKINLFV